MDITYKEAAEIVETVVALWDDLSNNPDDLSAMSDHCHGAHAEALYVASLLKKKDGELG